MDHRLRGTDPSPSFPPAAEWFYKQLYGLLALAPFRKRSYNVALLMFFFFFFEKELKMQSLCWSTAWSQRLL